MLLAWIKQNKKLALKVTGVNFLLMALVLLFWSQAKPGMNENEKAAANLARMEGQVSTASQKPASSTDDFKLAHSQYQEGQVEIFLAVMLIFGVGFLGYGFLKKEEVS